jgi:hypothetical protein
VRSLAALACDLRTAACTASTKAFVILDGTLLPIDRIAADRPFYSGKHEKHGMNVQIITDPAGRLVWASPALPGAVRYIKAARTHGIIDALEEAGVECWADKAYRGVGGTVRLPYWGRWETLSAGSRLSTARMQGSLRWSSRPWPPSRPAGSYVSCDVPRLASPAWFRPSSPCI